MIRLAATETERVRAGAFDGRDDDVELTRRDGAFDGVFAVGCGTPTEEEVVVDVGAVQERAVAV
jgi:hypothetical protein